MARERPLRLHRCEHGFVCAPERVEERVALRVDLVTAVLGEGHADQPLVLGEHLRVALPQPSDKPGGALDVREHERDRTARKLAHRTRSLTPARPAREPLSLLAGRSRSSAHAA